MPAPISRHLSPPLSHAAAAAAAASAPWPWCRRLRSRAAPFADARTRSRSPLPPASPMSAGRFAVARSCSSSSSAAAADQAGASSPAGTVLAEEHEGIPFARLPSDVLLTELTLPDEDDVPSSSSSTSLLAAPPMLHERQSEEDGHLGETPAYPAAMNALYAACFAGNVTEQLWSFTWPAAVATLHPSLLPVAVLGFFSKLVVFAVGPLVGHIVSSLSRIPAYRYLSTIQTAAHLVSAAMIAYAFAVPQASAAPELLLRPWFAVLVASTAVDTLSRISLGVVAERDFVVELAGAGRPVALAQANATLSRVDLICETAGASIFAVLLSKNHPLTCIRLSCIISLCALPLQIFLGGAMNRLAGGIFDRSTSAQQSDRRPQSASTFSIRKIGEEAWGTIRHGWIEYVRQPVLPASLAYVLLCFNVALAPGALMTTFLIHHGVSPAVLGAFGGSSAVMGILATLVSASLVRELGILRAGAAGLVAQSALLGAAVVVYLAGLVSRPGALFVFLGLIVASRLGHMAYSVIGLQVVQTGNPMGKAKLIGATEIAVASLAELSMMAVAVAAGDASHFGSLAALSAAAVAAAAGLYCCWMANPTDELKRLFPF